MLICTVDIFSLKSSILFIRYNRESITILHLYMLFLMIETKFKFYDIHLKLRNISATM
jgi:hypothetical protein